MNYIIDDIKNFMVEVLEDKNVDMSTIEKSIYYMNGNDGTDFDWNCNGKTCEFFIWYNTTERGAVKLWVNDDGTMDCFYYGENGYGEPERIANSIHFCTEERAEEFKEWLEEDRDDKNIYDEPIIDF